MMSEMTFPLVAQNGTMPEIRERDEPVSLMGEDDFRAFYERTARPLWAYLMRVTNDRNAADDAFQEAYYRFYRAGTQYESESHRRNSLFRIATNVIRDAARRARHRNNVPLDDEQFLAVASNTRTADIRFDLAKALGQLEPLQREMLWLAYAQGASHEEIGQIVGVRTMSVRTLLLRARRKVARFLTGEQR